MPPTSLYSVPFGRPPATQQRRSSAAPARNRASSSVSSTHSVAEPNRDNPLSAAQPAKRSKLDLKVKHTEQNANGVLQIVEVGGATGSKWNPDRYLRVWTPADYTAGCQEFGDAPVLLLNDGQNLFDDALSFSGASWRVGATIASMSAAGSLPKCVAVGIDNDGSNRSFDYCPNKPGPGPKGMRSDAKDWPGGGSDAYLAQVVEQILPAVQAKYGASASPSKTLFGGSSLGGISALQAATAYADVFGRVLCESPSLWVEEGALLERLLAHDGALPQKMFLAMGGKEYTDRHANSAANRKLDALMASWTTTLHQSLKGKGMGEERLQYVLEATAIHNEAAWARRLPMALDFLLGEGTAAAREQGLAAAMDNMLDLLAKEAKGRGAAAFVSPKEPVPGQRARIYVDCSQSTALQGCASIAAKGGFNRWSTGRFEVEMAEAKVANSGGKWWMCEVDVPPGAEILNCAFHDGDGSWENNGGADFGFPCRRAVPEVSTDTGGSAGVVGALAVLDRDDKLAEMRAAAEEAASEIPLDHMNQNQGSLFLIHPPQLVPGAPATVFCNPAASLAGLGHHKSSLRVCGGFNNWTSGNFDAPMESCWWVGGQEWFKASIEVPEDAYELSLAFGNGGTVWDNNDDNDFVIPVKAVRPNRPPREIDSIDRQDLAGGTLELVKLKPRADSDRRSRWKEERLIRVWLPAGYSREAAEDLPVLYMNDGKNLFEDWLAHQGVSWRVADCCAHLIGSGALPPFIVVGIDSPGPFRSQCYLPFPPGKGYAEHRPDAERWPGGGVDSYMERVVYELMPMVADEYGGSLRKERLAFGGGSFGGVCALYAAMKYPDVFGAFLCESPSLWSGNARFLEDMASASWQPKPGKLFMAVGTHEYGATRDHEWPEIDQLLTHYACEANRILEEKGLKPMENLAFQVQDGAGHHEGAWGYRLDGALRFLCAHWWDEVNKDE